MEQNQRVQDKLMGVRYDRSEAEWDKCLEDEERIKVASTWTQSGTLDRWRHERMLESIKPFINNTNYWLTVGDGRFGADANFIISNGGKAHASDISEKLLKIGNEKGFISDYSAQNAENLGFADNSFDYVLIKEAFHHFPRPWTALHEAFRVCKKAVILIEPNDDESNIQKSVLGSFKNFMRSIKRSIKDILGKENSALVGYDFEPVGNFVYSVNPKELEKFLLGMHYRHIATKGMNDHYEKGAEFVNLDSKDQNDILLKNKVVSAINKADRLCNLGLQSHGVLLAALFKEQPNSNLKKCLSQNGWQLKVLPENPYL